jgi:hypothetical protein
MENSMEFHGKFHGVPLNSMEFSMEFHGIPWNPTKTFDGFFMNFLMEFH